LPFSRWIIRRIKCAITTEFVGYREGAVDRDIFAFFARRRNQLAYGVVGADGE
jgi:hypothetical protein